MKKTNFVLSRATGMRASVYSTLKYTLLLLIFTLSVPAFSQSVPKLVDRDVAMQKVESLIKTFDQYQKDVITSKDQITDEHLRELADRYEAKYSKLYGFTSKAADKAMEQVQLSYAMHVALGKQLQENPGMSTEDAVRVLLSASNVNPANGPALLITPNQENMREEIVTRDIIPYLLAN